MKKIKKVEFVFENCETIEIPVGCLYVFSLEDIKERISRKAINLIAASRYTDNCAICISKNANKEYQPFGVEHFDKEFIFDRIRKYNDITYFDITYDNGESETIYVDYKSESEDIGAKNLNMETYINDDGHLFISICDGKSIYDIFDTEDLAKGSMHFFEKFEDKQ